MVKYFDIDGNELIEPDLTDMQLVVKSSKVIPSEPAEYEKRTATLAGGTVISWKVKVKDYVPAKTVVTEYTVVPIEKEPVVESSESEEPDGGETLEERITNVEDAVVELADLVADMANKEGV
jgi:hypothetical protein